MSKPSDKFFDTEAGRKILAILEADGEEVSPPTKLSLVRALTEHIEDVRASGGWVDPEVVQLAALLTGRTKLSKGRRPQTAEQRSKPRWTDEARADRRRMREDGVSYEESVRRLAEKYRKVELTIVNELKRGTSRK